MDVFEPMAGGDLHVWCGTAARRTVHADWAMLSRNEREVRRPLRPLAAASYAASRAAARRILGRYLQTAPTLVDFGTVACDSPGCAVGTRWIVRTGGPPLSLSLSHSGTRWLLAVGRRPVGVHVEELRPVDVDAVQAIALSDAEQRTLARADTSHRSELFFRCWTRKAALAKAVGIDGYADLRSVDVQPEHQREVVVEWPAGPASTRWRIQSLDAGAGLLAAVASPADADGHLIVRDWPVELACVPS